MKNGTGSSNPSQRRYSPELKERAVRMVLALRAETGERHGSIKRVADQLDVGVESLRSWVNRHEVDHGERPGTTTADTQRIKALEQENREPAAGSDVGKPSAGARRGAGHFHLDVDQVAPSWWPRGGPRSVDVATPVLVIDAGGR